MNLFSYIKKAFIILKYKLLYRSNFSYPYFYLFNLKYSTLGSSSLKKILFYFNDPEFMHIGDHLFFIQLLKNLQDNGYMVDICPIKVMESICSKIGLNVVPYSEFHKYDLIVTRSELISNKLKHFPLLTVNISQNLTLPISDDLVQNFKKLFGFIPKTFSYDFDKFNNPNILAKFNLDPYTRYLIFNPYCDSNFFLITQKKIDMLNKYAKEQVLRNGFKVLLVGTQANIMQDKYSYNFEYIDLRGKTTIEDILELAAHERVGQFVGFDNFIMHVFSILKKPSNVVYRGRLGPKKHEMIKKSHLYLHAEDNFTKVL